MPRRRIGTRTIAVVNGKGGSSKTPTTAMLAAVLAQGGSDKVLAWDNNETRGTLGWRTERAAHEANVRDLLPAIDRLTTKGANPADLDRYVHPQSVDGYDVLQSDPAVLPGSDRLTGDDVDAVHRLVSSRYQVIVVDSGNAVDAPNWLRMLDRADQIVIPTTTRTEHAESARLLLSAFHGRDARSAALADQAVVIVSHADSDEARPADIAGQFEWLARAAVTIPYDAAMRAESLRLDSLAPATQQAWRRAADAVLAADLVPADLAPLGGDADDTEVAPPEEATQPRPAAGAAAAAEEETQPRPAADAGAAGSVDEEMKTVPRRGLASPPPPPTPPRAAARPAPAPAPSPAPPSPASAKGEGRPSTPPQEPDTPPTAGPAATPAAASPRPAAAAPPPAAPPATEQKAPEATPQDKAPDGEASAEEAPRRRLDRRLLLGVVSAVVVVSFVVVLCLGGRALVSGDEDGAVPSGPAPVEPVDGWSSTAEWVSPAVAKGKNSPVLVSGSTVITVTSTSRGPELTAMDADDGTRLWSSKIDGKLTGPPQLITHDDEPVVVAATENTLMRWSDLDTEGENEPKTPETWDFTEAEVELVEGSPVPLLANEETVTALVLVGDELKKRTFPSDTTPVAADDKGRVTALRDSGHWYAVDHATRLPEATLLEPPMMGSLVRDVLGTVGSTVVVSWSAGGGTSRVVGYDMTASMKPLWETSVDGNPEPGSFTPSPDGDWAIVDTLAVDARTGETEQLPKKWKTLGMTGDRAWSRTHAVSNEGRVAELEDTVEDRDGLPVAVTSGGLGLVVAAEKGEARRIHALRPSS